MFLGAFMFSYQELCNFSDERLCELAVGGDREAENVLATRYLFMVRAAARPYFLAGGDSEDLIQEGMLGLLSAIREYDSSRGRFSAFASSCVKNRIISGTRAAGREKHQPLNGYLELNEEVIDSDRLISYGDPDPAELLSERESYDERLGMYRAKLSAFESSVLGLYLEGFTTAEIGSKLGKNRKSVENAVARIRRKLADSERGNNG